MKKGYKIWWIFCGIIVLGFIGLNVWIFLSSLSAMHFAFYEQRGEYEVALLFGAGVRGSRLSPILEDRAMTAFQLFDSGKIKKILISADNSSPEYDEVRPTRDFLIAQGVKSGAIYLDFAGFDSYDSLYRAKEIFWAEKLVLVSQKFHLPRLLFLCRGLGLECVGAIADQRTYQGLWYNYVRESLANVKATFSLLFHVQPHFLWEEILLNGESNAFGYD